MIKQLHITNGSHTVKLMQDAGIKGEIFSWDDILHEGPVPSGLDLFALSLLRGDFLIEQGYATEKQVREKFSNRDGKLKDALNFAQVTLWFEHDLYDQLQLIQILDWFNQQKLSNTELYLIQSNDYLGRQNPDAITKLTNTTKRVSQKQLDLASEAWRAFTFNKPTELNELITKDTSVLTWLNSAINRLLMEYPNKEQGLPQTEKSILKCLEKSSLTARALFFAYGKKENAEFMGDTTFWWRLNQMALGETKLLEFSQNQKVKLCNAATQKVALTDFAKQLLNGQGDWFGDNNMSRWIGGCQLSPSNKWYYCDYLKAVRSRT